MDHFYANESGETGVVFLRKPATQRPANYVGIKRGDPGNEMKTLW